MKTLFSCVLFSALAFAANPVPFVSLPLVPDTHSPGGNGFTLVVHGAGFVSGATVNWNGSSRNTTFVSGSTLRAAITAGDIANAGTAAITVSNPGGGVSDVTYFTVRTLGPLSFAVVNHPLSGVNYGGDLAIGDFNRDGNVDVAVTNHDANNVSTLQVFLGNGDGTFQAPKVLTLPYEFDVLIAGDFNGDGKLDLAGASRIGDGQALLGNGDGTFVVGPQFGLNFGQDIVQMATADLNGDGMLDMVIVWDDGVQIETDVELGNGDGSFNDLATFLNMNRLAGAPAIGDFDKDGKLDVAVPDSYVGAPERAVDVFLGNGDGTFQSRKMYSTLYANGSAAAGDLNGDGTLDVATDGISVLLNKPVGHLHKSGGVHNSPGARFMQLADMNGDGFLDAIVNTTNSSNTAEISVAQGNGDGTFQAPVWRLNNNSGFLGGHFGIADFNNDGKLDIVGYNTLSNQVQFSVFLQQ